jgi:creatinine amidohydrolase
MASRLLMQELTREEIRASAPQTLLVLPVGAIEQHGPHLPVATDFFAVEHIARGAAEVAAKTIPVVVAPTLPFGSSHHHLPFGGTMSLSTETYYRVLHDLASSLIGGGFRRLFIVNGHGGNDEIIQLVARDLALTTEASLAAASYWTIAWDALTRAGAHEPGNLPGHAGAFETSVVLALRPDLVHEPRPHRDNARGSDPGGRRAPYRAEMHGWWQATNGFTDSPDRGDAARGETYLAAAVTAVADALTTFHLATGGARR